MKNILLAIAIMYGSVICAQEGPKIGFYGSLPIDDFNDEVVLAAGLELGYMHALGEVVDLGAMTGFINGFPETFHSDVVLEDLPHVQFVPLALSVRIWPSNSVSFGGEVGQAFGINSGNEGGFYYRPVFGYLLGARSEINVSYTTINLESRSWTSLNVGFLFTLEF